MKQDTDKVVEFDIKVDEEAFEKAGPPEFVKEEEIDLAIPSMFRTWQDIAKTASIPKPVWGNILYEGAVTVAVGDPDIGKTTLGYALGKGLIIAKEFLNLRASKTTKTVLLDYESEDNLVSVRYYKMNEPIIEDLLIFNGQEAFIDLIPSLECLHETFPFTLLIVDNFATAFDMKDENDNAEAKKKIQILKDVARRLHCAILVFHHPSKANLPGTRKGSGAFSVARFSDIGLNLNYTAEEDVIEMEVTKNRYSEDRQSIYFKLMGDGVFESCPAAPSLKGVAAKVRVLPIDRTIDCILTLHGTYARQEIDKYTMPKANVSQDVVTRALRRLTNEGRIISGKAYGAYDIP